MKNLKQEILLLTVIFAIAVVLNLFSTPFAAAQEEKVKQEEAQEGKAQKEYELEPMTVTAPGKREEKIHEVPLSITALSEIQIEDARIVDTEDLIYHVPNLFMIKSGNHGAGGFLSIRGITTYMKGAPTVGFYVDDVYYSDFDTELFNIERIEVLKGPQGTLYGRNTEAGVINIVTKKPGDRWEGKASAGYGKYNSQTYNAAIGGPLVQNKLFFRIAGNYFLSDGYFDNKFLDDDKVDDRDDLSGRALLRWTPTDDWDITLSSETKRYRDGNDCFAPLDDVKHDYHDVSTDFAGYSDHDVNGQYLRAVYNGKWFTLTSITGYRNEEYDEENDWDFGSADLMRGHIYRDEDTFSQEIRLASVKGSIPLEWLAGVYYFDEETDFGFTFDMRQANPAWGMPAFKNYTNDVTDTKGYAFFGQGTYTFFEKLGVTAGLRYDHETKDFKYNEHYDPDLSMFGMLPRSVDTDATFKEWLPKFAVDYRWTPNLMTYASVARGYKSGGFNSIAPSAADMVFDPEYTWNYELGIKSSWMDNRLSINLAGFYIDWKDQQVEQQLYPEAIIRNAAESTSKGFEVEVLARPATGLEFIAGFGYTDAKFEDYTDDVLDPMTGAKIGEVSYDDKRIPNTARYTYNLSAQYRHINGLFSRVDLLGTGDYYYDLANTEKQSSYQLVNARLGYEMEHFEVYLWAKNLFDEEYVTRAFEISDLGGYFGRAGDPRRFGIMLTARF
jgi:iron complex outermembrane receptor protein